MVPESPYHIEILLWTVLYSGCGIMFFGIALWVIMRGGRDIIEILKEAHQTQQNNAD